MDNATPIIEFTRVYLAAFYTFVAAFYAIRITAMKRAENHEVVFPGARLSTSWWNHMLFRVFRISIWMVCVLRLFFPALDTYLGMLPALSQWPLLLTGNILITAGFLLTIAVHYHLGPQWRSGIDPDGPDTLRTGSFYRYSRNPMFVGVAVAQAGFFLALPSAFSALCLLLGWYTLHRQILVEEAHLEHRFRDDYSRYRGRVRRWL